MYQFKILTKAVDLFKKINNGEDEYQLRLKHVKLYNERKIDMDYTVSMGLPSYTMFDYNRGVMSENLTALEHARICAYEELLTKQK